MVESKKHSLDLVHTARSQNPRVLVALGEKYEADGLTRALVNRGFSAVNLGGTDAVSLAGSVPGNKFLILDEKLQPSVPMVTRRPFQIVLGESDTSARVREVLDSGADQYLKYPISLKLLVAHMNSMLRRESMSAQQNTENLVIEFNGCTLDTSKRTLYKDGKLFRIRGKEYDLLRLLGERIDGIVTKEEITKALWGIEYDGSTVGTIRTHVHRLRRVLDGPNVPSEQSVIIAFPRVGYMLMSKNPLYK